MCIQGVRITPCCIIIPIEMFYQEVVYTMKRVLIINAKQ